MRPEKRSDAQNRLLHACLSEISKQVEWAGAKRDVDTWKRLLTAAWLRARESLSRCCPLLTDMVLTSFSVAPANDQGRMRGTVREFVMAGLLTTRCASLRRRAGQR